MSEPQKEQETVDSPGNCFQERPLEEITQNRPEAEGIVFPARFFV
jgi:hypothetical protein